MSPTVCLMVLGTTSGAGNVSDPHLQGLFEEPAVLRALFGATAPTLKTMFHGLAAFLEQAVKPGVLETNIHKD